MQITIEASDGGKVELSTVKPMDVRGPLVRLVVDACPGFSGVADLSKQDALALIQALNLAVMVCGLERTANMETEFEVELCDEGQGGRFYVQRLMDIKELEPRLAEAERIRKMFENAPEAMRLLQSIVDRHDLVDVRLEIAAFLKLAKGE